MAGHNKWSQIKHKKAKEDSKRGKAFTKLIKEITVAARTGGGDPAGNPRLRQLLEKAKEINMPIENSNRAIKRGTGELPGVDYQQLTYEGYGPAGIAIIIETLTDNKNRTVAELRHLFSSKGGSLAETGAVSWMFEQVGVIRATNGIAEDELLEKLIDFEIKDLSLNANVFSVSCDVKALDEVKKAMQEIGLKIETAELEWISKNTTDLPDHESEKVVDLLSALDDLDDVQNVYANLS